MADTLSISNVELDSGDVSVEWADGHRSTYEARYLRLNCACAECVEEWSNRKVLDPATVAAGIQAEDYMMVGNYGIQFLWSDAHSTGIYTFDLLRRLCTCEVCKAGRA